MHDENVYALDPNATPNLSIEIQRRERPARWTWSARGLETGLAQRRPDGVCGHSCASSVKMPVNADRRLDRLMAEVLLDHR
jgi:hypothetical protein